MAVGFTGQAVIAKQAFLSHLGKNCVLQTFLKKN
jgi:hypothetical protein